MSIETKKVIVKRRYSRSGCIECKRRKIKCDEVHPTCGNCQRVKFPCVYPAPKISKSRRPRNQKIAVLPPLSRDLKTHQEERYDGLHSNNSPQTFEGSANGSLSSESGDAPTTSSSLASNTALQPAYQHEAQHGMSNLPFGDPNMTMPHANLLSYPPQPQIGATGNFQTHTNTSLPALPPITAIPDGRDDAHLDMLLFENVLDDANTLVNSLATFDVLGGDNVLSLSTQSTPDGNLKPFHSDIILNGNPSDNHFINEAELQDYLRYGTDVEGNPEGNRFLHMFNGNMPDLMPQEQRNEPSNEDLLERVNQTYRLSSEELEYFRLVVCKELVLFMYPFAPTTKDNKIMHVLLEYLLMFKYLVHALIALGASCLFTITKNSKHDRNQKRATAICMKLLVQAFTDLGDNEESLRHIEGLILTVLILTLLFSDISIVDASTVPVSWISHLNKARSLLIKYRSVKQQIQNHQPDSPGITIAKLIFFEFDWISKLGLPTSQITKGSIRDIHLLVDSPQIGHESFVQQTMLRKLGVLIPPTSTHTGFNLFSTITNEVSLSLFKLLDVIANLNDGNQKQASPEEIGDIMALIHNVSLQQIIPNLSAENQFLIPHENPAHPDFTDLSRKIILPSSAYAKDTDDVNDIKYYSYCDLIHRSHYLVLNLKAYTSPGIIHLPRSHTMIKRLVDQTLKLMFFLKRKSDPCYDQNLVVVELEHYWLSKSLFDFRAIMMQLPFRMTVDLTDNEDDFEKLDLFFRGLVKFGGGSGIQAVARARQNREAARKRKEIEKTNGATGTAPDDMKYLTLVFPIY